MNLLEQINKTRKLTLAAAILSAIYLASTLIAALVAITGIGLISTAPEQMNEAAVVGGILGVGFIGVIMMGISIALFVVAIIALVNVTKLPNTVSSKQIALVGTIMAVAGCAVNLLFTAIPMAAQAYVIAQIVVLFISATKLKNEMNNPEIANGQNMM